MSSIFNDATAAASPPSTHADLTGQPAVPELAPNLDLNTEPSTQENLSWLTPTSMFDQLSSLCQWGWEHSIAVAGTFGLIRFLPAVLEN